VHCLIQFQSQGRNVSNCPTTPSCAADAACDARKSKVMRITPLTRAGTVITWDLTLMPSVVNLTPPLEVNIEYSRSAAGSWVEIMPFSAVANSFTVPQQLVQGSNYTLYYRINVRDALGNITASPIQHVFDTVPKMLTTPYLEAVRRWYERCKTGELREGYLLKRSRWGQLCPDCTDRDGRQKIRSQCLTCFDAGFIDGFQQVTNCFFVEGSQTQVSENFTFEAGWNQDGPIDRFTWLHIPQVFPGDVWVDANTDERWVIGNPMTTTVRLGAVELMASAPVARVNTKHVIYSYPVIR